MQLEICVKQNLFTKKEIENAGLRRFVVIIFMAAVYMLWFNFNLAWLRSIFFPFVFGYGNL